MQDRNYDAVIFDMDGTLLDTLEDLKDAVNHALRVLAMPERTLEEIRQFVGNGAERLLELAVPGGAGNPQYGRALALFREYYAVHCNDKTRPYDGVIPLLQKLAEEGYALAIVSNKPDFAVKELCDIYFSGLAGTAAGRGKKAGAGHRAGRAAGARCAKRARRLCRRFGSGCDDGGERGDSLHISAVGI